MNAVADVLEKESLIIDADISQAFASAELSDTSMTASHRMIKRFDSTFPGWQLYRRVVAGFDIFDAELDTYAVTSADALSRSKKECGRSYIGEATRNKPDWIAQAGRDALYYVIHKRFPMGLEERAGQFGVHWATYKAIRDPIAGGMIMGLKTFKTLIEAEWFLVRRDEKRGL